MTDWAFYPRFAFLVAKECGIGALAKALAAKFGMGGQHAISCRGKSIAVRKHSLRALYFYLANRGFDANSDLTGVKFNYRGTEVELAGADSIPLANDIFAGGEYGQLDVKGKDVLDIGANIGDTAIYFALNGAKKVIAIEPFPFNYGLMLQNLSKNRMEGIVVPMNVAAGKDGKMVVGRGEASGLSRAGTDGDGETVECLPLGKLAKIAGKDAALKIDIEGAEYGLFEGAGRETMRNFSQIILEYHGNPGPLLSKLEQSGFRVAEKQSYPRKRIYAVRE